MLPLRFIDGRVVRLHCDVHHRMLELGARAFALVNPSTAVVTCPGSEDGEGAHQIELDPDWVPFRLSLVDVSSVAEGSGAHPDKAA